MKSAEAFEYLEHVLNFNFTRTSSLSRAEEIRNLMHQVYDAARASGLSATDAAHWAGSPTIASRLSSESEMPSARAAANKALRVHYGPRHACTPFDLLREELLMGENAQRTLNHLDEPKYAYSAVDRVRGIRFHSETDGFYALMGVLKGDGSVYLSSNLIHLSTRADDKALYEEIVIPLMNVEFHARLQPANAQTEGTAYRLRSRALCQYFLLNNFLDTNHEDKGKPFASLVMKAREASSPTRALASYVVGLIGATGVVQTDHGKPEIHFADMKKSYVPDLDEAIKELKERGAWPEDVSLHHPKDIRRPHVLRTRALEALAGATPPVALSLSHDDHRPIDQTGYFINPQHIALAKRL